MSGTTTGRKLIDLENIPLSTGWYVGTAQRADVEGRVVLLGVAEGEDIKRVLVLQEKDDVARLVSALRRNSELPDEEIDKRDKQYCNSLRSHAEAVGSFCGHLMKRGLLTQDQVQAEVPKWGMKWAKERF